MKKCPVCNKTFNQKDTVKNFHSVSAERRILNKRLIFCPHCVRALRKKKTILYLVTLIPFVISCLLVYVNKLFIILAFICIIIHYIFYRNLPYEPYDD